MTLQVSRSFIQDVHVGAQALGVCTQVARQYRTLDLSLYSLVGSSLLVVPPFLLTAFQVMKLHLNGLPIDRETASMIQEFEKTSLRFRHITFVVSSILLVRAYLSQTSVDSALTTFALSFLAKERAQIESNHLKKILTPVLLVEILAQLLALLRSDETNKNLMLSITVLGVGLLSLRYLASNTRNERDILQT